MNKTININLAGLFFHIDENAYDKLQRYISAIKRSFTDSQGRDEIIQDIEARIAELFTERIKNERQVIGLKEVDEVIEIMGQPEDYRIDEELFEDETSSTTYAKEINHKKLFRDTDKSIIGGVAAGLEHYSGVDTIWWRILFIFLAFITGGGFIIVYIICWIFIPEALTTSEKLQMKGKPVNIDNIQRKVKEGFENVADSVKNVDYERYGNQAKKGASGIFSSLGKIISFLLTAFVKFIGILLVLIGSITVLSLFVGLFTAGTLGFYDGGIGDFVTLANTSGAPLWLISTLCFFAVGIPFLALFYLGLKILVSNLKSVSLTAKLVLLGLWLLAILGLGVLGVRQATAVAMDGETSIEKLLDIPNTDTLKLKMTSNSKYGDTYYRSNDWKIKNIDGKKILYNRQVRLIVRNAGDDPAHLVITKKAQGASFDEAFERAQNINYNYSLTGNQLALEGHLTAPLADKMRDQEVEVVLYIPEGMTLFVDDNVSSYHRNSSSRGDLLRSGSEEEFLLMENGELNCISCPANEMQDTEWKKTPSNNDEWKYRDLDSDDENYDFDTARESQTDGTQVAEPEKIIETIIDSINL